jgi:CheY-like chemotaxis protein
METKSILVIEDNDLNMELVVAALELSDYRVLQARDAETGIQLARTHLPDLILMDIQLPGMDGYSATRVVKGDPATKGIPVVALTAYAMKSDQERALQAGCLGYISKPFSLNTFLGQVKAFLTNPANPGEVTINSDS